MIYYSALSLLRGALSRNSPLVLMLFRFIRKTAQNLILYPYSKFFLCAEDDFFFFFYQTCADSILNIKPFHSAQFMCFIYRFDTMVNTCAMLFIQTLTVLVKIKEKTQTSQKAAQNCCLCLCPPPGDTAVDGRACPWDNGHTR